VNMKELAESISKIDFFTKNSTQIWTLLSVVVGGFVSYISTSASEKRKSKRQSQKEKLDLVLIPYCTCLEQTITQIKQIYQQPNKPNKLFAELDFEKWENSFKKPLEYLEAAKRVFLSQSMREKLKKYSMKTNAFLTALEQECTDCQITYKNYLSSKLQNFPNVPKSMFISISMDSCTDTIVKTAIINKSNLSLLDNITGIRFVKNDDPENYRFTYVTLNDDIRETWGAINYGVIDISDIEDSEVKLACILLDYIGEKMPDEQIVLSKIIDETQGANALMYIIDELNEMRNELIKTIDKITK